MVLASVCRLEEIINVLSLLQSEPSYRCLFTVYYLQSACGFYHACEMCEIQSRMFIAVLLQNIHTMKKLCQKKIQNSGNLHLI